MVEEKVTCRTPNAEGATNIPKWKFETLRAAILDAIDAEGDTGLAFSALAPAVGARLSSDEQTRLGSLGWHVTTVKLELEVAGEIMRVTGAVPQRLLRVKPA